VKEYCTDTVRALLSVLLQKRIQFNGKAIRIHAWTGQDVEAARISDSRYMKVARLPAPTHRPPSIPRIRHWYSFLLGAELARIKNSGEPATFRFVAQGLTQLPHLVAHIKLNNGVIYWNTVQVLEQKRVSFGQTCIPGAHP